MSVAEILREYGIATIATKPPRATVAAQTLVPSHATTATTATTEKHKARAQPAVSAPVSVGERERIRTALLALADGLGLDRALVHRLTSADVDACHGLPVEILRAYLLALDDTATRWAGKVPEGETAAIYCERCGPVFTHPAVAAVLPVVNGWPRALGCRWCAIRKAGGYVPRPKVTCETCMHWQPDATGKTSGMGACANGHGSHYPMQLHVCGDYQPNNEVRP